MSNPIFNKNELDKFKKIYKNLESDDEFEVMFGGYNKTNQTNMEKFLNILKYLKTYAEDNKFKMEYTNTLDISYNYDKNNYHTYRLSINSVDRINELVSMMNNRKNHVIFSILVANILNGTDKNLLIINKIKDFDKTYNIDEYDIRVRLSKEKELDKKTLSSLVKLESVEKQAILFRYKSRLSVIVESNSNVEIRIDLTSVKSGNNINIINNLPSNYELELEDYGFVKLL